jgi:hypothetical protein
MSLWNCALILHPHALPQRRNLGAVDADSFAPDIGHAVQSHGLLNSRERVLFDSQQHSAKHHSGCAWETVRSNNPARIGHAKSRRQRMDVTSAVCDHGIGQCSPLGERSLAFKSTSNILFPAQGLEKGCLRLFFGPKEHHNTSV